MTCFREQLPIWHRQNSGLFTRWGTIFWVFLPFKYKCYALGTTARPITSTPWSMASGARSFHSLLSQKQEGTATSQGKGLLQTRTQVTTSHVAMENLGNAQQSNNTIGNQNIAQSMDECDPNSENPGYLGGGSDPPDDDPPGNPGGRGPPRNNEHRMSHRGNGHRCGRGGGPPDPPSSSLNSNSSSTRSHV